MENGTSALAMISGNLALITAKKSLESQIQSYRGGLRPAINKGKTRGIFDPTLKSFV